MRAALVLLALLAAFAGCGPALYTVSLSGYGANVTFSVDTRGKSGPGGADEGEVAREANRAAGSAEPSPPP